MDPSFADTLLVWYHRHKRDLPWRHTQDPYPVWLSEVILQQTRVDQGIAYYHRFLQAFPSIQHLALASEEEVLKLWQGLGYYSRARNLHGTAKSVVAQGGFPKSYRELLALKGIGPYTAAAISSFCFKEVQPVLDGNVFRVFSRMYAVEGSPDSSVGRAEVMDIAHTLIDAGHPDIFNQAIMEFGALQCTPKNPNCGICPFQSKCLAFAHQAVDQFPRPKKKTQVKEISMCFAAVQQDEALAFIQRKKTGIWKGLFEFPSVEIDGVLLQEDLMSQWFSTWGIDRNSVTVERVSEPIQHVLSHRKIHAVFMKIQLNTNAIVPEPWVWSSWGEKPFGVSRLVEKGWELFFTHP
ncbi:MAG: A/G-specific adenine glycosylase [Flavobacteriales bacterium]